MKFQKTTLLCYRLFDIAEQIDLEEVRRLLSQDVKRFKFSRHGSQYLQLANPPLVVELGNQVLRLSTGERQVEASVRLFDHGAASLLIRVSLSEETEFEPLIALANELYDSGSIDYLSTELIQSFRKTVEGALEGSHLWDQSESYTITFVEKIEGSPSAEQILSELNIARLLLGETDAKPLSDRERREVTQHWFSYRHDDLAVIDWNSAFVYEPSGSPDIPDVLEICNAQLLEFRYYDEMLDRRIQRIYDEMQEKKQKWRSIWRSPYRALARRTLVSLIEISEFTERVENSLKIIGDFYLAKVFEASLVRLRVRTWQTSVTRKQRLLAETYTLLKGEIDTDRSLTIDFLILLLIVSEIVLAVASLLLTRSH